MGGFPKPDPMDCKGVKMTLMDFIESNRESLRKFNAYWREKHESNPDDFPMELNTGDWDEQLESFNWELGKWPKK